MIGKAKESRIREGEARPNEGVARRASSEANNNVSFIRFMELARLSMLFWGMRSRLEPLPFHGKVSL